MPQTCLNPRKSNVSSFSPVFSRSAGQSVRSASPVSFPPPTPIRFSRHQGLQRLGALLQKHPRYHLFFTGHHLARNQSLMVSSGTESQLWNLYVMASHFASSSTTSLTTGHALDRGSISSKCPGPLLRSISNRLRFLAATTYHN